MSQLLYLYGFLPAGSPSPPGHLKGIEESGVELLDLDGFLAAVSYVPEAGFREPELGARLRDVSWVAERGLLHERVVTWFVDHRGILPARLLTLYRSPDALVRDAQSRGERIRDLLGRFADRLEWHLKIARDPGGENPRLGEESEPIREIEAEIAGATPGRAYLLRRKRADLEEREADAVARRLARELFEEASGLAVRSLSLPGVRTAEDAQVILNAAFLARREDGDAFRRLLEKGAERVLGHGLDVTFSGPWAPYRFIPDTEELDERGPA